MTIQIETGATDRKKPLILYQNIFETGTVTVSSETSDGDGANALEDTTFDFWTAGDASASISVDYGSAVECDCFAIAAHTLGTVGATVSVSSSDDGVTYSSALAEVTPTDDETIIAVFFPVTARYWRISITDGPSSIGVLKLGRHLLIDGGVINGHVSIAHAKKIELLNSTSIGGQYLGNRIKRIGANTTIDFGFLDSDFVDTTMREFEDHYNSGRTFFFAANPAFMPDNIGYCWRPEGAGELRPSYEEGGELMSVSMEVSAYVES